ncbi:MAG: tetratricopeptide repeat protein [Cyanobacteria bacterium J06648_16]
MDANLHHWYRQQAAKLAYRHGCTYARQENHARAIATFTRVLTSHPDPAKVYTTRGLSYQKQGNKAAALQDFNTALAIDANQAQAYGNRGLLRYETGDRAGALADWATALVQSPNCPEIYYNRALLHIESQNYDAAMGDLNQAIALNPNTAEFYFHRGNLQERLGNIAGAVEDWRIAACNDLSFEETQTKLAQHQEKVALPTITQALKQAFAELQLSVRVQQNEQCLAISIHREVGVGISYYRLPELIREVLVPLELPDFTQFELIGRVGDIQRAEWSQKYDLYKGQPCPPSNWQSALSAFVTCPPFGLTALIYALQVQSFYKRGAYPDALRASKTVRQLSHAGVGILCALTMIPLSYTAYTALRAEPTPPQRTARSIDAPISEPANPIEKL